MWNVHDDNDIVDFALLWAPLGGPAPDNVAAAFAVCVAEYKHRLRHAARSQLSNLQLGTVHPERIYGSSALTALDRDL